MFYTKGVDPNVLFGLVTLPSVTICNSTDKIPEIVTKKNGDRILKFRVVAHDMIGRDCEATLDCEVSEQTVVERCLKNHLIYPGGKYCLNGKLKTVSKDGSISLIIDVSGLFKATKK